MDNNELIRDAETMTIRQMATKYNATPTAIRCRLWRAGIRIRSTVDWSEIDLRTAAETMTIGEIADHYGATYHATRRALDRRKIKAKRERPGRKPATPHGAGKKRGPRPRPERRQHASFRIYPSELAKVKTAAEAAGLTLSQYIRHRLGLEG